MYTVLEKNAIDIHGHNGVLKAGLTGNFRPARRAHGSIISLG
jgi:hypothetical protein